MKKFLFDEAVMSGFSFRQLDYLAYREIFNYSTAEINRAELIGVYHKSLDEVYIIKDKKGNKGNYLTKKEWDNLLEEYDFKNFEDFYNEHN
jgi:hypothetical protein